MQYKTIFDLENGWFGIEDWIRDAILLPEDQWEEVQFLHQKEISHFWDSPINISRREIIEKPKAPK